LIRNLADLRQIRNKHLPDINLRTGKQGGTKEYQVMVCSGTGCASSGSDPLKDELIRRLKQNRLERRVKVFTTGCFGFCKLGPIMVIHPGEVFYQLVEKKDLDEIIKVHFIQGQVVERLLYREPDTSEIKTRMSEIKFFAAQQRVTLRNCGLINPEDINEYIAVDGYAALGDVLINRDPVYVIDAITRSGLRGRGGGGFPSGRKWLSLLHC